MGVQGWARCVHWAKQRLLALDRCKATWTSRLSIKNSLFLQGWARCVRWAKQRLLALDERLQLRAKVSSSLLLSSLELSL